MHRWFFQQLVLAVDFCHTYGVAMRDITLDKVLLKSVSHDLWQATRATAHLQLVANGKPLAFW